MTREEAIEVLKKKAEYLESDKRFKAAVETLIPELAESEDEKIYNEIMAFFKMNEKRCIVDNSYTKWIAWLEKQKENIEKEYVFRPLAGTDITIAAEQAIRRANEGDRLILAFNGAYIPVRKGCDANKIVDIYDAFIEKQKEQKPNFSEKDSTDFEIEVHEIIAQARNDSRLDDADVLKQFEEEAAFALMLKANKLIEQKPAEWRHYIWAINMKFDYTALIKYDNTDNYEIVQAGNRPKQEKNGVYILIKDIKPQSYWKPSKEQMEVLKDYADSAIDSQRDIEGNILFSLYDDLEKLM